MTCIQIRVFPVRVVYNEPTNSCRSSLVVGWETESTAPSTATIQPRSAVAVLEAEHVAPHAKPPWHSFRFHKNSVQTLTLYSSTWESKCKNSFKNMKSNSISTNKIRIFEPLKNCWWLMVKFQVGNCLRLSVINPPTPEPPKAHLTGANRSATNPGAFWSITNGATVVTVTDTIAAFTKHLRKRKGERGGRSKTSKTSRI